MKTTRPEAAKHWKPEIGQHVRFNAEGFQTCHLTSLEEFQASQNMRVTKCHNVGRPGYPIWDIEVDQPAINKFMIHSAMLEPVTP